jgi:hypothetical protein
MRAVNLIAAALLTAAALGSAGCASTRIEPTSQSAASHGGYRNLTPSEMARGKAPVSIDSVRAKASSAIRMPSPDTAGDAVSIEAIGADQLPRAGVGLAAVFNKGILFTAEPQRDAPLDLQGRLRAPSAPFTDGRKAPFEIVTVDGMEVAVQRGGHQYSKISGDVAVNAALEWQDGDVVYTMQSDVLSADALLATLRSMYR